MASIFVSDNSGLQPQRPSEPSRPKRPRSSLACLRCRKKKVKCDFVQPTCGRCGSQGLLCNYAQAPRRVDGRAFDQLGNHVEELKERMKKMQTEIAMMKSNSNLNPFSNMPSSIMNNNSSTSNILMDGGSSNFDENPTMLLDSFNSNNHLSQNNGMALMDKSMSTNQQSVTWKISYSPSGLRIDTNIASVADLYRILLNGISQLNINSDSATSLFSTESIKTGHTTKKQLNKDEKLMPGMISNDDKNNNSNSNSNQNGGEANGTNGKLWEVDEKEARQILQEQQQQQQQQQDMTEDMPPALLDRLMHTQYHKCFLAYQIVDKETFMKQYMNQPGLDPLLANSISAWVSKHGCVYHDILTHGQRPSKMGATYFKSARQILKRCFDISSPNTIHALLNLYMYQLSSEKANLAYLYIGLAIRMAQDLKYHKKEHMPSDPIEQETNKRLWWSAYWLDLCTSLESNRPTMVDDKDCDIDYPTKLDSEDEETGYRVEFCVHSIKLMKIRKDITKHLPSEQSGQSLLSAISRLENALTNWLNELPKHLRFDYDDTFQKTDSFRDEAMLILNIQYQTTWIMLHKFFLPKKDQTSTPVALLSLNICTKAANFITRMLELYATHLPWCQFFYAMDGVIASVSIHQVNALSNENELPYLAQRNLIKTSTILSGSPLTYMEKVNDIIESIHTFLKENNLSTNIDDVPSINEESINQQSISSVFHPSVFDQVKPDPSLAMSSSSSSSPPLSHSATTTATMTPNVSTANITTPIMIQQQQQPSSSSSTSSSQQQQQQQHITAAPNLVQSTIPMTMGSSSSTTSTITSASIHSTTPAFNMSSPRPIPQQHSRVQSQTTVPSQLSPQRYSNNNSTAMSSPIPMTQSPHPKIEMIPSLPKQPLPTHPSQQRLPPNSTPNNNTNNNMYAQIPSQQQQHAMVDPSMIFSDTMMGMDPSFFQNMGTPYGQPSSFTTTTPMHHPSMLPTSQQQPHPDMATVFQANAMLANATGYGGNPSPQPHPHPSPSHHQQPQQHPGYGHIDPSLYPSYTTPFQPHPPPPSQVATSTGLYNTPSMPTTSSSTSIPSMYNSNNNNNNNNHPHSHHHSNSNTNHNNHNNHNNNTNTNNHRPHPHHNNNTNNNNGLMPNGSNNLLNMDPMNAYLQYSSFPNSSFGFPPQPQQQPQPQQPQQQQQQQQMMNPELMYMAAANRKRQRDWDQQDS